MALSKTEILNANDVKVQLVRVPEWGGDVYVRVLSGTERDKFEQSLRDKNGKVSNLNDYRARFAALVISDEKGTPLFQLADVHALGMKSSVALNRIVEAAQALNAVTDDEVEELTKNSESGLSDDSGSD
jgi:hypothetical protein